MREPAVMTEDGHFGTVEHRLAQAGPAAWNDCVKRLPRSNQLKRNVFLRALDQDPCAVRNAGLARRFAQRLSNDLVRQGPVGRPSKDAQIAGFETKGDRLYCHQRLQLGDNPNDPDGHAHTRDDEAIRSFPSARDRAYGIGSIGDDAKSLGHFLHIGSDHADAGDSGFEPVLAELGAE